MTYMLAARPGTRAGETRGLSDWPPLRPSGPEPGSADGPPWPMPFAGLAEPSTLRTLALVGAAAFAGWWLFFRKKPKKANPARGRRRRRRRSRRR